MEKLRDHKERILDYFASVQRATLYHLTNRKQLSTKGTEGDHRLTNLRKHVRELKAAGFIKESSQKMNTTRGGYAKTEYLELTEKGRSATDSRPAKFAVNYPNVMHQYAVMTGVTATYFALGMRRPTVRYDNDRFGFKSDCIIDHAGRTYIHETERSRSVNELASEMRKRYELAKKDKDAVFVYSLLTTKLKNKDTESEHMIRPWELYEFTNPMEKRIDQFINELMPKIADLPSWKFYITSAANFDKFDQAVFHKPGKKGLFKLR